MQKKPSRKKCPRTIRFDSSDQVNDLKKAAKKDNRNFNSFVVHAAAKYAQEIQSK